MTLTEEKRIKRNEYMKQYREKNRQKTNEAAKQSYRRNAESRKNYQKNKWYSDLENSRKNLREKRALNLPQSVFYSTFSRKKDCEYNITEEYIKSIWPKDDICPVFGIKMKRNGKGQSRDDSPSIDKIDPSKGYTIGNVVIVSFKANRMKNNGTVEDLKKVLHFYENQTNLK